MRLPRGVTIALSPMRRTMFDFLAFSRMVPLVSMERRMHLAPVVAVRKQLEHRPSWFALFLHGLGLASIEIRELRQSFLTFPWPRIHQHSCTVASLIIVREVSIEEQAVFMAQFRHPESESIAELDERIQYFRKAPIHQIKSFRMQLWLGTLPTFVRHFVWWMGLRVVGHWHAKYFGTLGMTGVAALGSSSLNILSPLTATLSFGVLEPDGSTVVRLYYDHRIMDGVQPALALERLEHHLTHSILAELKEMRGQQGTKARRLAA